MSRPLRIEYKDAWYHIMNRGKNRETIYRNKIDFDIFTNLLVETSEMWNFRISAYCLMPNHYHLLIQTPDANISRGMRHLNGIYTQRFNRRYHLEGSLFKGRYKSIIISEDKYLLQVVKYIHLNPVKAGIVDSPEKYAWSSHKGYISPAKKWNWIHKQFILNIISSDKKNWLQFYKKFMGNKKESQITDQSFSDVIEKKRWPICFGHSEFVNKIKGMYYSKKISDEIPQSKELAPDKSLIIQCVCDFYKVNKDSLKISKRGYFNEPRNVAIYLLRKLRHDNLDSIGQFFKIEKYYTVSSIISRMKKREHNDKSIKKHIDFIITSVNKCHEKT